MSNTKHTPGPWQAMQKGGINAPWNVNVPHLSDTDSMKYVAGVFGRTGVEQEANAHLIAAAPAMLEALQRTYQHLRNNADATVEASDLYNVVTAALAQATNSAH